MKKCVSVVIFLLLAGSLTAQEKMKKRRQEKEKERSESDSTAKRAKKDNENGFSWRNVRVGGNLGAAFGSFTYLQVAPMAGYVFNEDLFAGLSGTYIYQSQKINGTKYEQNIYGLGLMGRYHIYEGIFAAAEYEALNYERYDPFINRQARVWAGSMFVGGGYIPSFDNFRGMYVMGLYNLNYTAKSPYNSPLVLRIGILF